MGAQPQPLPGSVASEGTPGVATSNQPATAAAAADPPSAISYSVGLERAIETVRMTVEMAARQGVTQARIQLSPESLGGIRIQLSQSSDGLIARVVAEHGAAAQTLQQGAAELRRSLESSGVPLLRLDIETSGQRGGGAADSSRTGRPDATADDPTEDQDDSDPAQQLSVELSNGAVVDVLA